MSILLVLQGIGIGFAIAAPVGPVAVLCIRRTLLQGHRAGIASGLGAVTADVIFSVVAVFGVAAIADLLLNLEDELRVLGGVFLLGMGVKTYFREPPRAGKPIVGNLLRAYVTAFMLTITNPLTIIAFTAIFAGFGVVRLGMGMASSLSLIGGVALGATIWWVGLTAISDTLRRRVRLDRMVWLNKVSGGVLAGFGFVALVSLLFPRPI